MRNQNRNLIPPELRSYDLPSDPVGLAAIIVLALGFVAVVVFAVWNAM